MKFAYLFLLIFSVTYSATYYVSTSGNDSYTPTQAQNQLTPWKSLNKINSLTFAPGDSILFKKGDSWIGSIIVPSSGTSGNPITYGAYDNGENPVIKGTIPVTTSWVVYSGNIYMTVISEGDIIRLFINGEPLITARYPNKGYLKIDDTLNSTTIKCNALNNVDWTTSSVHVRTKRMTIGTSKIISCNTAQKTFAMQSVPGSGTYPKWGFFINNKLEALDTAGEWYYDANVNKLYLWTPNGDSPSNYLIEGSVYDYGILINGKSYVTVNGLSIIGHSIYGITAQNTVSNIIIDGNTILYPDGRGIDIDIPILNSNNNIINNNIIIGANHFGIVINGSNTVISNNTIKNTGLISNFTRTGMGNFWLGGDAILTRGANVQIKSNVIDSAGYIGISSGGTDNIIEYNLVKNCCLCKDDGGGIYAGWQSDESQAGSAGTIIRRNIVLNTQFAPEGTPDIAGYPPLSGLTAAEAVYIDDYGHDITITENTLANCAHRGIYLHNNKNITITNNILYNNKVQLGHNEYEQNYVRNNIAKNNVFYSIDENQICMATVAPFTDTNLAFTDSNYYCNPYNDVVITYAKSGYSVMAKAYTLNDWNKVKNMDANSKESLVKFLPYKVTNITGSNLISNSNFTSNISSWNTYPFLSSISWDNNCGLDSGCMKVLYTDNLVSEATTYPSSFGLSVNQPYQISFSVISNKRGTLQSLVLQPSSPWGGLGFNRSFIMDTTRKDYSAVFTATATEPVSSIRFCNSNTDSLYWIDNISIVPVQVTYENPLENSKLFYNATNQSKVISLGSNKYCDLDGNSVTGSITLEPFRSKILILDTTTTSNIKSNSKISRNSFAISSIKLNHSFKILLEMYEINQVSVDVYDLMGRFISNIVNNELRKGTHSFVWSGKDNKGKIISSGNYFVIIKIGQVSYIKRFIKVN